LITSPSGRGAVGVAAVPVLACGGGCAVLLVLGASGCRWSRLRVLLPCCSSSVRPGVPRHFSSWSIPEPRTPVSGKVARRSSRPRLFLVHSGAS
jgi:hypothetical protein